MLEVFFHASMLGMASPIRAVVFDITGTLRYALTPLTQVVMDAGYIEDRFVFRPAQNTENLRANVGFEFAPDAVIRGRAALGFRRL